jgi:Imidazoleglycerol-phosphate dehydratase
MKNDTIVVARKSRETDIELKLGLFPGASDIRSGMGFLDHLLTSLAHHAGWTVQLRCRGDLEVDEHHSAEDVAIVLGIAFKETLADRRNPRRFGTAYAPLDEALARAVVDLSGRPWCRIDLGFRRESIGSMATENIGHVLQSFAINAGHLPPCRSAERRKRSPQGGGCLQSPRLGASNRPSAPGRHRRRPARGAWGSPRRGRGPAE